MEKECEEKKVLEQEAAEELKDEQMECVSGGQRVAGNEDMKNGVGGYFIPFHSIDDVLGNEDMKNGVGGYGKGSHWCDCIWGLMSEPTGDV